jgi:hypothetical protein
VSSTRPYQSLLRISRSASIKHVLHKHTSTRPASHSNILLRSPHLSSTLTLSPSTHHTNLYKRPRSSSPLILPTHNNKRYSNDHRHRRRKSQPSRRLRCLPRSLHKTPAKDTLRRRTAISSTNNIMPAPSARLTRSGGVCRLRSDSRNGPLHKHRIPLLRRPGGRGIDLFLCLLWGQKRLKLRRAGGRVVGDLE